MGRGNSKGVFAGRVGLGPGRLMCVCLRDGRYGAPKKSKGASLEPLLMSDSLSHPLPQNRPSVITCASASTRNCNLSHCPIAHSGCAAGTANYRRVPTCKCLCLVGSSGF